jgi:hypothetical protein
MRVGLTTRCDGVLFLILLSLSDTLLCDFNRFSMGFAKMSGYFASIHMELGFLPPIWLNAVSFVAAMIYPLKLYLTGVIQRRERVPQGVR